MDYKQSFYDGALMSGGILISTFAVKKVSKDMAPQLTMKNAVSLTTVTILSQMLIDYLKSKGKLPVTV